MNSHCCTRKRREVTGLATRHHECSALDHESSALDHESSALDHECSASDHAATEAGHCILLNVQIQHQPASAAEWSKASLLMLDWPTVDEEIGVRIPIGSTEGVVVREVKPNIKG
uniref:Uncharacterized protein n=1 Tax=Timema genevievae TaxID=629358 RepID=A0A7R9PNV3_TIMGE|nr:unnamed protein product [Timema genevievae]